MSEVTFRIEQLDSITKGVCEICDMDVGVRTQVPSGDTLYVCSYCKKLLNKQYGDNKKGTMDI